ncbi:hypothetical protein DOO74_08500 [Rhodobacteraceae bacterium AsT-22]|nr:hypothetical protein DOO74_08500 [Rhodobacteraceae bacterium AsT-22]
MSERPSSTCDCSPTGPCVSYGLRFHTLPPRTDHRHHWFRLGDMLNFKSEDQLEGLIETRLAELHHGMTAFERDLIWSALHHLHQVIWADDVVNYYIESSRSVDRVLDIFVRANDGGTKLSKSDLLMSMITSKWENGSARDAVFGFVDHINKGLGHENKITKDFVMKACLVLCGFDVKYNVSNFTTQSITDIERKWPAIKDAIERTFRFLNGLLMGVFPSVQEISRPCSSSYTRSAPGHRQDGRKEPWNLSGRSLSWRGRSYLAWICPRKPGPSSSLPSLQQDGWRHWFPRTAHHMPGKRSPG